MASIVGTSFAEGTGEVTVPVPTGTQEGDLLYAIVVGPNYPDYPEAPEGWRNLNPAASNAAGNTPQTGRLGLNSSWDGLRGAALVYTRYCEDVNEYTFYADEYSQDYVLIGGLLAVHGHTGAIWESAGSPETRSLYYQDGGVGSGTCVYDVYLNPLTFELGNQDQHYWYGPDYFLPYPVSHPFGFVAHVFLFDDDPGVITFANTVVTENLAYHTGTFVVTEDHQDYTKMVLVLGTSVPASVVTQPNDYQQWQSGSFEVSWDGAATDAKHVGWYSAITEDTLTPPAVVREVLLSRWKFKEMPYHLHRGMTKDVHE